MVRNRTVEQLVPLRVRLAAQRSLRITHAGRTLKVPVDGQGSGARVWATWRPSWRTDLLERISVDRPGAFVDVGANLGQTMLDHLAAQPDHRYIGFEPIVQCAAFLEQIVDLNHLEATILPLALSDRESMAALHFRSGIPTDDQATLVGELRPGRTSITRFVPTFRLDLLWPLESETDICAVKIDVEGAEVQVLEGMAGTLAEHRPPVICEVLLADKKADMTAFRSRMERLSRVLEQMGYIPKRVVKADNRLVDLAAVDAFPIDTWTPDNAANCDYVFSPS